MKRVTAVSVLSFALLASLLSAGDPAPQKTDPWKPWLDEVRPIITRSEEAVYRTLQTVEDRARFEQLFWRIRDPDPATPENEFRKEYYARRSYAEKSLRGVDSDRGRVYILLGKPTEKYDFSGLERVVDCELWVYQNTGLPGLAPLLELIFFRENNVGDLKLYYPGANSPLDILSSSFQRGTTSKGQAYRIISKSFPELGRATLSVTPDESDAAMPSLGSGAALAQVFSLPERQADRSYLKGFGSAEGVVEVTSSTAEIAGRAALALSRDRGFLFLNYAVLPDAVNAVKGPDGVDRASVLLALRIEDPAGTTVHQQERSLDIKFDAARKKALLGDGKLVFSDFAPVVEGDFTVSLTFMNRSSNEFFVYRERLTVGPETIPVMVGHAAQRSGTDRFVPFRSGAVRLSVDPRFLFTREDSLEVVASAPRRPEVWLEAWEDPKAATPVGPGPEDGGGGPDAWAFHKALADVPPGNYVLRVRLDGREAASRFLTVLSFPIKKPLAYDRSEPASASVNYDFIVAQEHLNKGEVDAALERFRMLPPGMGNATTLPVIARAYYLKKDHAKVVELLDRPEVARTYPVLVMLGNAFLETKDLRRAAETFELVRKYGDTAENNRVLGAIYYSLGERDKARAYWERAKALEERKLPLP